MTERHLTPYPADDHDHDHHDTLNDLGLQADTGMLLRPVLDRRRVLGLGLLGSIGLLVGGGTIVTATAQGGVAAGTGAATCPPAIPTETAGPYPADGSGASGQSLNVLTRSGIVRRDLRTSLGTGHVAAGVPLTLNLKLVNVNASCAALTGYAVYVWHCTADGEYSMYSREIVGEDYLRGVQTAGADGTVTFQTIFPGCYAGRWPHIHFEVYPTLALATGAKNKIQTSQLALPQDACEAAYATPGYEASIPNLARVSLDRDGQFRDGVGSQMVRMTGSAGTGYTANLTVGLAR